MGFHLLIPWVKTDDDGLLKMFEGIIPKEYLTYRTVCMDDVMITQQDRAKDSEDKQLVQVDLQKLVDSLESGQGYAVIPGQCQKVTHYPKGEDDMKKVEYLEQFQAQHLGPQVTMAIQEKAPQAIFQIEESKKN